MPRRKRQANTFNLSFLDIMSCGFGAVVLVFLIIDHSTEIQIESINAETLSEIELLDEEIREGEAGLVRLRNAIRSTDLEIVEAQGRARDVREELNQLKAFIASLEKVATQDTASIKAETLLLERQIEQLLAEEIAEGGVNSRDFQGDGSRQYVTGLNLGGTRIALLFDVSASMLDKIPANIFKFRVRSEGIRREAPKWKQALATLEWITAQLPIASDYKIITFNETASFVSAENTNDWEPVAAREQLDANVELVRAVTPDGGTSLYSAFDRLNEMPSPPDNIFLITDGLPTQGKSPPTKSKVSSSDRIKHLRDAKKRLPKGVPVNIILLPMRGDPEAATELWELVIETGGALVAPAQDWP